MANKANNGMICCAIETEPKTLREGQLSHARVTAADVAQKLEPNGDSSQFTKGLKRPNIGSKEMKLQILIKEEEEKVKDLEPLPIGNKVLVDCNSQLIDGPCQCSIATITESPPDVIIKEPLSAPF